VRSRVRRRRLVRPRVVWPHTRRSLLDASNSDGGPSRATAPGGGAQDGCRFRSFHDRSRSRGGRIRRGEEEASRGREQ
jgi:hypothetical protein